MPEKRICPYCEKTTRVVKITEEEEVSYKNEIYILDVEYLRCTKCKGEWDDPKSDYDPLEKLYRLEAKKKEN